MASFSFGNAAPAQGGGGGNFSFNAPAQQQAPQQQQQQGGGGNKFKPGTDQILDHVLFTVVRQPIFE